MPGVFTSSSGSLLSATLAAGQLASIKYFSKYSLQR